MAWSLKDRQRQHFLCWPHRCAIPPPPFSECQGVPKTHPAPAPLDLTSRGRARPGTRGHASDLCRIFAGAGLPCPGAGQGEERGGKGAESGITPDTRKKKRWMLCRLSVTPLCLRVRHVWAGAPAWYRAPAKRTDALTLGGRPGICVSQQKKPYRNVQTQWQNARPTRPVQLPSCPSSISNSRRPGPTSSAALARCGVMSRGEGGGGGVVAVACRQCGGRIKSCRPLGFCWAIRPPGWHN